MIKRIRIGILGVTGKMGKRLQDLIVNDPSYSGQFQLVYACSGPNDPRFTTIRTVKPDLIIDFSAPLSSLRMASECKGLKIALLICTTGFSNSQLKVLKQTLKGCVWAMVPNTSLGTYVFAQTLAKAARMLPKEYQAAIVESHHILKKDAPSGTAKMLAEVIRENSDRQDVPIHSIRGGTEVGEHSVVFLGPDEKIELIHRVQDRSLFAHGALGIARLLLKKKPQKSGEAFSASELYVGRS
jgi:4-hydroxy-tetrahydrodipicolinate reductase